MSTQVQIAATASRMNSATVSIITSIYPARIGKAFSLGADGALIKEPGGNMSRGIQETRTIGGLDDLAAILTELTPAQALTYGIPRSGARKVYSANAYRKLTDATDATTRELSTYEWPAGGGVLMLDYDPPEGQASLDRDGLVAAIRDAAPGLADVATLWFPSAGSNIFRGADELRGVNGQRLWFIVEDAADIPRAGEVLADRLWIAGHGIYTVSKSGSLLPRTLIDTNVWQTNRLDFAGGSECRDGLEQRRAEPMRVPGAVEVINSRAALPDLTGDERRAVERLKAAAKDAMRDASAARKALHAVEREAAAVQAAGPNPVVREQARARVRRALGGSLSHDFPLLVEVEGQREPAAVTVADVLADPETWDSCKTRDPLDPDAYGGAFTGKLFLLQPQPALFSFAHGGARWRLEGRRDVVQVAKDGASAAVDNVEAILRNDPVVFDYGPNMVYVDDGSIHTMGEDLAAYYLGGKIAFETWHAQMNRGAGGYRSVNPPRDVVKQLLSKKAGRKLKPLSAVVTAPVIRADGTVLDRPGYDEQTGLFLDVPRDKHWQVIENPTRTEARAALATLWRPFEKFPFVDAKARSAMLAAALTAAVRPTLPTAPAFGFDAPTRGSGKTLLALSVAALAGEAGSDVWSHVTNEEEIRKRLTTIAMAGRRAVVWDNIIATFDSANLASFLTSDGYSDRILGGNEEARFPNRSVILFSGNNLSLVGDLSRRVIVARIDPNISDPYARRFDLDPLAYVRAHRQEMVAAACTVIRGALLHNKKRGRGRLASFENWDDLVRTAVIWCGDELMPGEYVDPMELLDEAQKDDPKEEQKARLFAVLYEMFGSDPFLAREAAVGPDRYGNMGVNPHLLEIVFEISEKAVRDGLIRTQPMGMILKHRADNIAGGMKLVAAGYKDNTVSWRILKSL